MAKHRSRYRLVGLDGQPHPVLDAPYDTLELALADASDWCTGQGSRCSMGQQGIAVEVRPTAAVGAPSTTPSVA